MGKTTTAVNLGAALAERGHRVLLIDLDAQAHLTLNMGVKLPDDLERSVYNLLTSPESTVDQVVLYSPQMNVHFLPANIDLAGAEIVLINEIGRESILREKLQLAASTYDFMVIDCPPALSLLTINAFVASDEVIIPLQCEYFGMKGMQQLMRTIERVRLKLNPGLRVAGILPTIYKARTLHSQEVLAAVREHFGDLVYPFAVTDSIRFAESPLATASILQYAPGSSGAAAYRKLARAIAEGRVEPGESAPEEEEA